jgi:cyclophilin family peptidyl-prolyl cis-trans isomerase
MIHQIIIIIIGIFLIYVLYNWHNNTKENFKNMEDNQIKKTFNTQNTETTNTHETTTIKKTETNENIRYVYFDISLKDSYKNEKLGRIIIQLFDYETPKTCKNFYTLVKDKKYKDILFHRVIKDFMIQGGDITNNDGSGGYSIYGDKFDDENFKMKHNSAGLLSMANSGPNTNGSQFFITVAPTPHLDGKHVVFGRVIYGLDILKHIENTLTDNNDKPIQDCFIQDCDSLNELEVQQFISDKQNQK